MADKTAMDAINEALGSAASGEADPNAPAETPEVETPETPEGETSEAETPEGETPEGETPEGEHEAEIDPKTGKPIEQGPNGERERNPDGTWKKAEAKKPDPVNDPIPKGLKHETRARMQSLVDTVKEKDTQRLEVKAKFDYMVGGIQATGATPEQYGETLPWLALFSSVVPANHEKALEHV